MSIDRRAFLTRSLGGAAVAGASLAAVDAQALTLARPDRVASPQAVGILYDSALCVGCKACVAACKAANGAPAVVPATLADWNQGVWDSAEDLDGRTLNVIKAYVNGTREVKALVLLSTDRWRRTERYIFLSACALLLAGTFYRLDSYLIAYKGTVGWQYFPSVPELMVTIGLVSLHILLFILFCKLLPVLSNPPRPAEGHAS